MKKRGLSPERVYEIIQSFIDGSISEWGWDDFLYAPIKDPYLKEIQKECLNLPNEYPPGNPKEYCNEDGVKTLKQFLLDLKSRMK